MELFFKNTSKLLINLHPLPLIKENYRKELYNPVSYTHLDVYKRQVNYDDPAKMQH